MADKLRVLFVCAKNDVHSLMAEALLRHILRFSRAKKRMKKTG